MWRDDARARSGPGRGERGVTRPAASGRRRRLLAAMSLLAILPVAGCATKRDVRMLSDQILAMQARQDSLYLELRLQNRALSDSVRAMSEQVTRVGGTVSQQLIQLQQHVLQVGEHVGQSHAEIAQIQSLIEQNRLGAQMIVEGTAPTTDSGAVADLYAEGLQQLERGNVGTARRAFQELLTVAPDHPLAPDAQLQIAESYMREQPPQVERALQEFEKVVQTYPNSPRAPTALYRAGVILEERGDTRRANTYFQRVMSGFPGTEEDRQVRARQNR